MVIPETGKCNLVADTGIDNAAITMALDNIANAATNDASLIATLMERIKALSHHRDRSDQEHHEYHKHMCYSIRTSCLHVGGGTRHL